MLINNFSKGVNQYLPSYSIEDDEFSSLVNATVRRGVVSKKLGSSFLGQLQLTLTDSIIGTTDVTGAFTGIISITPNSGFAAFSLALTINSITYTDNGSGFIVSGTTTYGSFNYATGAIVLSGVSPSSTISATVGYYPGLPVMGIGTFQSLTYDLVFFLIVLDTTYAYTFNYGTRQFFSISYYNMAPPVGTPSNVVTWTGADYQQFDFQNFQDCVFLTNNQVGMQFRNISTLTSTAPQNVTVGISGHGLVEGDQIFFYEVQGMTQINGLTGTVLGTGLAINSFEALVPLLSSPGTFILSGIVQYLTSNAANPNINGIRYYTTDGSTSGFVNFAPPLQPSSIVEAGGIVYYLVGCKFLIQYGNRLLALNCTIQDSLGNQTSQPNTIYYSQINSALYTIDPSCWYNNPPGTGGFYTLSGNQNIVTCEISYEQLIIGLAFSYRKLITTGSTINPFVDYIISDVYGSICPFASVLLDNAVLGIANVGVTLASTNDVARIDATLIPDATQEISRNANGLSRVCAVRDYLQQLIYFTYPESALIFPSKSIVFNYIEKNWSFYYESFTSYGQYLEQGASRTWATVGTWADAGTWGDESGENYTVQVSGGTATGAVLLKGNATYNEPSMLIQSISIAGDEVTLGIVNHNLTVGQYIFIENCLGVTNLNGLVFLVVQVITESSILISPLVQATGTYLGLGTASVMDNFLIQTKQYIPNWEQGQGSELTSCRVLLEMTSAGQISGQVTTDFLPFSLGDTANDVIMLASAINTMQDTNLGLSGNQYAQASAWHRLPVLSDGQTIQFNLFLSPEQMRNPFFCQSPVVLQGLLLDFKNKGQVLC